MLFSDPTDAGSNYFYLLNERRRCRSSFKSNANKESKFNFTKKTSAKLFFQNLLLSDKICCRCVSSSDLSVWNVCSWLLLITDSRASTFISTQSVWEITSFIAKFDLSFKAVLRLKHFQIKFLNVWRKQRNTKFRKLKFRTEQVRSFLPVEKWWKRFASTTRSISETSPPSRTCQCPPPSPSSAMKTLKFDASCCATGKTRSHLTCACEKRELD